MKSVEMYWSKFSGPLLDRIDMRVKVSSDEDENPDGSCATSTGELRKIIARAVKIQRERQGLKNAELRPDEIGEFCKLEKDADRFLKKEIEKNDFSPRAVSSCLRVARTICDMEERQIIGVEHIREAVDFRKVEGGIA